MPGEGKMQGFEVNYEKDLLVVYFDEKISKKTSNVIGYTYSGDGKNIGSLDLNRKEGVRISNLNSSYVNPDEQIVTGTYFSKDSKKKNEFNGTIYSSSANDDRAEGVFVASVFDDSLMFMKYHSFMDFDHFFDFLPEWERKRLEEKMAKKEEEGKSFAHSYRVLCHDVIVMKKGYLFIGEAYYPTYITNSNGRTQFDGYQYSHATIAMFDFDGNKLWDESFLLWPTSKPMTLKELVTAQIDEREGEVTLMCTSQYALWSKKVGTNGLVERDVNVTRANDLSSSESIKRSYPSLEYWYSDYFLGYGYQKIKDKEEELGNKMREVYRLTKVKIE